MDDLKITITVKNSPMGDYSEIEIDKPAGMSNAQVIGELERAKMELILKNVRQ